MGVLSPQRNEASKKSPTAAIFLSILPGGGQFYTENYLKGAIFALTQTTLLGFTVHEHLQAERAKRDKDWENYEYHSDKRYDLLWWDGIVWTLGMADAYISAHFYKFKEQSRIEIGLRF